MRFFNTAGPNNPQDHYCLPPLERFDLDEVLSLIAQKKYFVLHAPRQTGKTTSLLALRDHLNAAGRYRLSMPTWKWARAPGRTWTPPYGPFWGSWAPRRS